MHSKIATMGRIFTLAVLMAVAFSVETCRAQAQLMSAEKEAALRASIPAIDDDVLARKIGEATLYTDAEMPPAYQFQPLAGGQGVDGTVFYTPEARLNNIRRFTNGNKEFPWRTPGGLDFAESVTDEFRFIWLPKRGDGTPWPVVIYRDQLEKSDSVNMPIPTGYRWIFPADTVIGEVLVMKFSDGMLYTYEMRVRTRELDDWDVEIFRPFPTLESLKQRIADLRPGAEVLTKFDSAEMTIESLEDREHPRRAFQATATTYRLPPIPNDLAKQLLSTTPFRSSVGEAFVEGSKSRAFAPTAEHQESIVPPKYLATFLGSERESCANCHQHTLRHVDRFQNSEWYGYIRGSDGIFSFHPVEPASIGPPDKRVVLRRALTESGMVATFDPSLHPNSIYGVAPRFENRPAASYPNTGRRTIRN
ncbi:MAG: hypothetical protein ACKV2Q_09580 [Planctomycetaceae bacterium]